MDYGDDSLGELLLLQCHVASYASYIILRQAFRCHVRSSILARCQNDATFPYAVLFRKAISQLLAEPIFSDFERSPEQASRVLSTAIEISPNLSDDMQ